jgi:hypothetical protein
MRTVVLCLCMRGGQRQRLLLTIVVVIITLHGKLKRRADWFLRSIVIVI